MPKHIPIHWEDGTMPTDEPCTRHRAYILESGHKVWVAVLELAAWSAAREAAGDPRTWVLKVLECQTLYIDGKHAPLGPAEKWVQVLIGGGG